MGGPQNMRRYFCIFHIGYNRVPIVYRPRIKDLWINEKLGIGLIG